MQCLKQLVFSRATSLFQESYSKTKLVLQRCQTITEIAHKNHDSSIAISENAEIQTAINKFSAIEGKWKLTRQNFDSDDSLHGLDPVLPGPLDECNEDLSHIGHYYSRSFNFAAYVDRSATLQKLVQLGVSLYKIEKKDYDPSFLLRLDFKKDIQPYILFLTDCGVPADGIGAFLTANPRILLQDLDDLATRIRYFRAHGFSQKKLAQIISRAAHLLNFSTLQIDDRLGYLQTEMKLSGKQLRAMISSCPKIVTMDQDQIMENIFSIKEEMGFDLLQMKAMVTKNASFLMRERGQIVDLFDYMHNTMKIPHELIVVQPGILLCRRRRLQDRHNFLKELKRDQYKPEKPLYVSLMSLAEGTDVEFCYKVAKVSIDTYNLYLKTL